MQAAVPPEKPDKKEGTVTVPCPYCKVEITVVPCKPTTCPWCEKQTTVHPHYGDEKHWVDGKPTEPRIKRVKKRAIVDRDDEEEEEE